MKRLNEHKNQNKIFDTRNNNTSQNSAIKFQFIVYSYTELNSYVYVTRDASISFLFCFKTLNF